MEGGHGSHEQHPRVAPGQVEERAADAALSVRARHVPDEVRAVDAAPRQQAEGKQVAHEVLVVARPYAVSHPGAVVVELGHADVADGAVLRSERLLDETRAAEGALVEAVSLGELNDGTFLRASTPTSRTALRMRSTNLPVAI